jgi:hypothetical protein
VTSTKEKSNDFYRGCLLNKWKPGAKTALKICGDKYRETSFKLIC